MRAQTVDKIHSDYQAIQEIINRLIAIQPTDQLWPMISQLKELILLRLVGMVRTS